MTPGDLKPENFATYPPLARKVATEEIALLRQLPTAFLPLLLRELIAYDWKFPAERKELDHQFAYLGARTPEELREWMAPFAQLRLSPELERVDWVKSPAEFSEQLSAHLWATHQIDRFRAAAVEYVHKLNAAKAPEKLPAPRLGIVVVGRGVKDNAAPLFRKLRPQGLHYTNVDPENGVKILTAAVAARAKEHPVPFGHWYIDGGKPEPMAGEEVARISYPALDRVRAALVAKMRETMQPDGGGPEALRSLLARLGPADLGMSAAEEDAVLDRFQISVLTEGSGTQIFSTTFVQWTAREALRRAQCVTLLTRYSPRLREGSMTGLLAGANEAPQFDPEGSLVDADMGAYYTWINQQRLAGADQARFLAWFEGGKEALAIGPSTPRGTVSSERIGLGEIIHRLG